MTPRLTFAALCATFMLGLRCEPAHGQFLVPPETQLTAFDASIGDQFGRSIAVSGNVAVVGAWMDDHGLVDSGSAYVLRFNGAVWLQEAVLLPTSIAAYDYFGNSVDVSGNVIVVGCVGDDDNGSSSGSAYVYRYNGSTWLFEQKLLASDGAASDSFGACVRVSQAGSADVVIVGANGDDDGGSASGAAYVFRKSGSTWSQQPKLVAFPNAAGCHFGASVDIAGDLAVVGAPYDDAGGADAGAAYAFRYNGSIWTSQQKLLPSDPGAADNFGKSVAIAPTTIVVGSPQEDQLFLNAGAAYVYALNGTTWSQSQKLTDSDGATYDWFGESVATDGNVILAGASGDDFGLYMDVGSAVVFARNGSTWTQTNKLYNPAGSYNDAFGSAVCLSGTKALVGSYLDNTLVGGDTGSAFYFEVTPTAPPNTAPVLTVSSPANNSSYNQGQSVTFTANATDTEEGNITADVTWSSSLQGSIGPGGSGFSLTNLVVGTHLITATVVDSGGLDDVVNRTVTINPTSNTAPTVTISSPANNSSYAFGQTVTFSATATDTQDGTLTNQIIWTSNLQSPSQIGTGGSFTRNNLVVGTHTITATVTDSGGLSNTKTRTITITASNTAPTVVISSPANNSSFNYGATVTFTGSASDQQQGSMTASLQWISNLQGLIGTGGTFTRNNLVAGTHIVQAYVTDSGGLTGSATRTITIVALPTNSAPVVSISSPAIGHRVTVGTPITFTGSGMDVENGNLSSQLAWNSNLQGQIGVGASFSYSGLGVGTHIITASVTDSGGLTGTASRTVIIDPAPIPAVDSVPNSGTLVNGTVTGSFTLTHTNNSAFQSITEKSTSGNPANRVSSLEYKWTIAVPTGGTQRSFHLNAWREGPEAVDNFVFAYSTNQTTWTNMVTVSQSTDSGTYQVFTLPGTLSGTVYIRVKDTNQTPGLSQLDKIHVDHMFIRKQ